MRSTGRLSTLGSRRSRTLVAPWRDSRSGPPGNKEAMAVAQELEHRHVDVDGVRLHAVEAGSGPLAVLLHGFPEFWYSWRHQIPALADAGFRVVAPDMRGYNLSSKPKGISSYKSEVIAKDIADLIH